MSQVKMSSGRMEPFVGAFEAQLLETGYASGTVKNVLKDVNRLGRWMAEGDIDAVELNAVIVEEFRRSLRSSGERRIP
ncbi:MAG: hypothetical protein ACYDEY_12370 [Acidimicrobiales bacterium]